MSQGESEIFPHQWPKTGVDELDPNLVAEEYYHGLLPREDVNSLLKLDGDFVVRLSHPEIGKPRGLVLSVQAEQARTHEGIKHFVIQKVPEGFVIENSKPFPSIAGLIMGFMTRRQSLTTRFTCLLKNPVMRRSWQLKHEDIHPLKKLGEGAFGEVYSGIAQLKNGEHPQVAIKTAKVESITKEQVNEIMDEARIMRNMNHPHIVKFYGVGAFQEPLLVVMEKLDDSLSSLLSNKKFSVDEKTEFCFHAALGIEYMHSIDLMHRDIAARNCLVGGDVLKISDFGMTRRGNSFKIDARKPLPLRWTAPEILTTKNYTKKSDVWAYGILTWEIFSDGAKPYGDVSNAELKTMLKEGYKLPFPPGTPEEIIPLVQEECWKFNPKERINMKKVIRYFECWKEIKETKETNLYPGSENGTQSMEGSDLNQTRRRNSVLTSSKTSTSGTSTPSELKKSKKNSTLELKKPTSKKLSQRESEMASSDKPDNKSSKLCMRKDKKSSCHTKAPRKHKKKSGNT
ncbi:unnamed protein product [Bursaphelenchus xylophilus]|uniref:Tyrosine-protein kinase n=1 Tax=Bursaphelenchus xylophilus TaxID=6326 RepID=A0A7I8XH16_BURXY|nr:unnamed protein product [Bursaphelenchus xylophilus]CAG9123930.1 unnamed protein product [Bursaphelenchus xylophilus]